MGHHVMRLILLASILQVPMLSGVCPLYFPPRMIKQPPTDELLFQVGEILIECEAEGKPEPEYRWEKNGMIFEWQRYDNRIWQPPARGSLVISAPRDEDLGQYQCIAENQWGTAISNSVFVRKAELNSFTDERRVTLYANEGDPFKLACQPPGGWPKPNVYWVIQNTDGGIKSINNSRMTLDPEGNLWFSNVTKDDASNNFWYACEATSVFRNEYKLGNRVSLNVISTGASASNNRHKPERQYVTRKNEVALRGKKIELYCIYGGTPLPQIVWNKDGQELYPNERIKQRNYGKSLIIKNVTFEDEGSYTCEASNGVGSAKSYSISLRVLAVPYFTVEPEIMSAAEDETVEFRCEASGVPEPQIKWIHNGKPIEEAWPNPRRKVSTNSIVIEKLWKNDTGNYGCNATNSLGYVYKDVYVNVLALPPEITHPPVDAVTGDGKTIRISCRVFGAPKPEVKWLKNGQELMGGRYKTLPIGDLEIEDVIFLDAGTYTCYASNKLGSVEASGKLLVKEHTRITDEPEDYEVAAGSMATFRCNAVTDSNLTLTIDWLSNGEEIDFEQEPRFVRSSDYSLTITNTTELDSGTYTCVARTELDETQAQATLTVQDVPNAPRLTGLTCLSDKAIVQWADMGDNRAPILRYTIQANTSFTPDTWEVARDDFIGQIYDVPMSPWANYTFRVLAWNKIGQSPPSAQSEVCTSEPDVPYKNPENVKTEGTDPHNLVISWTVMPQIEHNAPGFMYRVFYKRDIREEEWITEDIKNWKQNSLRINNQPTYKRYKVKVLAVNERGESRMLPTEVGGWSGEDQPLQAPESLRLIEVLDSSSARLAWNPVSKNSIRGHFKGYKIRTWTDDDNAEGMRVIVVRGNKTQKLLNNVLSYGKNYAWILAFNGRYDGPASEVLSFDMPEGLPGIVDGFNVVAIGSNALYLTWGKPRKPNGILTGYRIHYCEVDGTRSGPSIERQPRIMDPEVTKVKLAGLKPATKYRIQIAATTRVGESEHLYYIEQTTRNEIGVVPGVPSFSWKRIPAVNGSAAIEVTWLPSQHGNPGSFFFVKYRPKGATIGHETVPELNEMTTEIRCLMKGEVYVISVVAVDGEYSIESLPEEVVTS